MSTGLYADTLSLTTAMAPRLCRGVGALALLLLLGQAAGRRPEKPDAEEGIRILEADEPRRWERIRIGGPPVRRGGLLPPPPAAAAACSLLPAVLAIAPAPMY